jgi:hypothetical protein
LLDLSRPAPAPAPPPPPSPSPVEETSDHPIDSAAEKALQDLLSAHATIADTAATASTYLSVGDGPTAVSTPATGMTSTPVTTAMTAAQKLGQLIEQSKQQRQRVTQQMAEMRVLIDQLEAKLKVDLDTGAAVTVTSPAVSVEATPAPSSKV